MLQKRDRCCRSTAQMLAVVQLQLLLLLLALRAANGAQFNMHAWVQPTQVRVGESATLVCKISGSGPPPKDRKPFSQYWWHSKGNEEVSENCRSYYQRKYEAKCSREVGDDSVNVTMYMLTIKSVQWGDRGNWVCSFTTNRSIAFVDVLAPSGVKNFSARRLSPDAELPAGDGSFSSPYDLADGSGLALNCSSGCGYPTPQLGVSYAGVRVRLPDDRPRLRIVSGNATGGCVDANRLLAAATLGAEFANCSDLRLDGVTRFRCHGNAGPEDYKELFVRCPELQRQYPLTHGEIAAVSVGSVLSVFLVVLGFVIFCRGREAGDELEDSATQPIHV